MTSGPDVAPPHPRPPLITKVQGVFAVLWFLVFIADLAVDGPSRLTPLHLFFGAAIVASAVMTRRGWGARLSTTVADGIVTVRGGYRVVRVPVGSITDVDLAMTRSSPGAYVPRIRWTDSSGRPRKTLCTSLGAVEPDDERRAEHNLAWLRDQVGAAAATNPGQ